MPFHVTRSRLLAALAGGALLAASPMGLQIPAVGLALGPGHAFAKDGRDDDGDDRSGRSESRSDDRGGARSGRDDARDERDDNRGGGSRSGRDSSDKSGRDREKSERDDRNDDRRGRGRSGNGAEDEARARAGGDKVEISPRGIEVVHQNGIKEEIRNGRYERKDTQGRTVEERPATAADAARLSTALSRSAPASKLFVGSVLKSETTAQGIEVLYSSGWKEEIENGRYELKDPNNNTVVERPAKQVDLARLKQIVSN